MDDRIDSLESRVDELSAALERVETELAALREASAAGTGTSRGVTASGALPEAGALVAATETSELQLPTLDLPWARLVFLTGGTFLILGGAFLLRALTDQGTLPVQGGVAAGLLYATFWLAIAGISGRGGRALTPTFHAGAAAIIAYPLLWEAATRFKVLSGTQAAIALGLVTAFALAVAWWRQLRVAAWLVVLSALATSFALQVKTAAVEPHVAVLILTGILALWMAYARGWQDLHWLPALGADLAVTNLVLLVARPGGPPEAYANLSAKASAVLALGLLLVYAGSFAVRTLLKKRDVSAFEIVQTVAAAIVGLGGAARIVDVADLGRATLGALALSLAVASYAVTFSLKELRWQHRRNFMFFGWQALIYTVVGSRLLVSGLPLDLLWCGLALGAALLGTRYRRLSLHFQCAVYLGVAASSSGLASLSFEAFLASPTGAWGAIELSSIAALGAAVACFVILALSPEDPGRPRLSRLPRLLAAVPAAMGAIALALVGALAALGARPPAADPAVVATARSVILAAFAVVLAIVSRQRRLAELRWILLAVLIFGGVKLFIEDLPTGRAATLFLAFAAYGLALILSPWIVRLRKPGEPSDQRPAGQASASAVGSSPRPG